MTDSLRSRYMDKKLSITLNGNRKVVGILRGEHSDVAAIHISPIENTKDTNYIGYDPFMNLVLEDAVEYVSEEERRPIGQAVGLSS